jgi:transcriptional regulator with XRE-family HTH domain
MFTNVPRSIRALRLRKGWSQAELAERSGVSREAVSRMERGALAGMTIARVDQIATALGASVAVQVRWQGEQLDRLVDAAHAALQQEVAELLIGLGWLIRVEVSFNHYGDRGRVDLLAFHPLLRVLLVVEIKSGLGDMQDTLGRIDVKVRLGGVLAREVGWTDVSAVVPVLVIGDSRTARNLVAAHDALFARFDVRGRAALRWVRRPGAPWPAGLLWFANRQDSRPVTNVRVRRPSKRHHSREFGRSKGSLACITHASCEPCRFAVRPRAGSAATTGRRGTPPSAADR